MTKLDKLIELNNLEKQNRRNRLEDKLKQQEYYGEIEELFDPLTKTISENALQINENTERNLALGEQTLRAIDWQNQELDKQTKMIGETASQIEQAGSQFNETASKMGETLRRLGTIEQTKDIAPVYVDTKTLRRLLKGTIEQTQDI